MKQLPDLELDPSEIIFDEIGAKLRGDGWAHFVTIPGLLKSWRLLASTAAQYEYTVDDYTDDLTSRDGLEIALAECPEPLLAKLKSAVEQADKEFLAGTQDDVTHSLEEYFRIRAGWWWRRTPRSGSLAKYLVDMADRD